MADDSSRFDKYRYLPVPTLTEDIINKSDLINNWFRIYEEAMCTRDELALRLCIVYYSNLKVQKYYTDIYSSSYYAIKTKLKSATL